MRASVRLALLERPHAPQALLFELPSGAGASPFAGVARSGSGGFGVAGPPLKRGASLAVVEQPAECLRDGCSCGAGGIDGGAPTAAAGTACSGGSTSSAGGGDAVGLVTVGLLDLDQSLLGSALMAGEARYISDASKYMQVCAGRGSRLAECNRPAT
jgi:hypothetical protein